MAIMMQGFSLNCFRFNERNILLGGFLFCLVGFFFYLPWGNQYPVIQYAELTSARMYESNTVQPFTLFFLMQNCRCFKLTILSKVAHFPLFGSTLFRTVNLVIVRRIHCSWYMALGLAVVTLSPIGWFNLVNYYERSNCKVTLVES